MSCCDGATHAVCSAHAMYKRRFDEDAEFKDRIRKFVAQLQGDNPQFTEAWQRICGVLLSHIRTIC